MKIISIVFITLILASMIFYLLPIGNNGLSLKLSSALSELCPALSELNLVSADGGIGAMNIIDGNSLLPVVAPPQGFQILGILVSDELYHIVECESGGNPTVCNQEFGCNSGMGLVQLVPSTVRYCEEKLGKKIDPFNPEDNLECGKWLLENEGNYHWGTIDTEWGSYKCWSENNQ